MTYRVFLSEFIGTSILVFIGGGAISFGNYVGEFPLGALPLAISSGGALACLIYALGHVSGCHINPSVTVASWVAGRLNGRHVVGYVAAQVCGAIVAAGLLVVIASGAADPPQSINLGSNGWGTGYLGEYSAVSAFSLEVVMTFIFVFITLGATSDEAFLPFGGAVIGLTLTILIIAFFNVTGVSLNPARSIGAAVFSGSDAISQLWLFILAPVLGACLAGLVFRKDLI